MRPRTSVGFGRPALNPSPPAPAPLPLVNSESDGMAGTFADVWLSLSGINSTLNKDSGVVPPVIPERVVLG
jgi:hypothetical protein